MTGRQRRIVLVLADMRAGRAMPALARDIGPVAAAWWYRHQIATLLRRIGGDPRWETWLAMPGRQAWPRLPGLPRIDPGPGDPGRRLARIFRDMPPGPVLAILPDAPGIRPAHLAEAFAMLGRMDAVFGPTPDGGFWLAGLARGRRPAPAGLFAGVRWNTPHALADSIRGLNARRIGFAAPLARVTRARDLATLRRDPSALPFP